MSRHAFLGSLDLSITTPLLTNYDASSTGILKKIKVNEIKHQDDLILIEVENLLSSDECNEIVNDINQNKFENMSEKYDYSQRNNSRLIVMDNQLAEMLWYRLKSDNKLSKLVRNTRPLGFNVQGQWEMTGVNSAMRLNKYNRNEYFTAHKDAQYAPSGDERSLFSLLIYLTDNYEKGETKFYFPKVSPKTNLKDLTIEEEIYAHGGLYNGYQCVRIKPQKGHAVLFTHNLLHEAVAPKRMRNSYMTQRIVLRSDVLVERNEKPLGFAVCPEEEKDYFACLDLFREAQQNELRKYSISNSLEEADKAGKLYERSLSIRYCYPRLLELKLNKSSIIGEQQEEALFDRLPREMWLRILKLLHEQDVRNLIFAYPQFQLLTRLWKSQEKIFLENDPFRPKYHPAIHTQYGRQTSFRFSDVDFFNRHVSECCRVAAVYAFFLLGHDRDATTYTVRYDRKTQEVHEVEMEQILADVFYNRNCYGSLYRVTQKNEHRRQPRQDFDNSVDRTYMINRHQSQFIGQDLLPKFHVKIKGTRPRPSQLYSQSPM
jgi:hypothetical protein